jgi:hypothetical protein
MPTDTIPSEFIAAVTLLGFSWLADENPALAREFGLGDQAAYEQAPRNTRAQSRAIHGAIAKAASHAGR